MRGKVVIATGFLVFFCCGYYLGFHNSESEKQINRKEQAIQIVQQLEENYG